MNMFRLKDGAIRNEILFHENQIYLLLESEQRAAFFSFLFFSPPFFFLFSFFLFSFFRFFFKITSDEVNPIGKHRFNFFYSLPCFIRFQTLPIDRKIVWLIVLDESERTRKREREREGDLGTCHNYNTGSSQIKEVKERFACLIWLTT